ncbi:MAG: GtrA family protein [Candidatus Peregrinibacteria bacterium]
MRRFRHWIFGPARSTRVQFFRYFWVGGISTVVDFAVFVFCVRVLGIHYLLAQFFAYCVGFVTNYALSILWVFQKTNKLVREITTVFVITMFGLLWTELLLALFIEGFSLGEVTAKVWATIIVLFWNFGGRRFIVYRNPPKA